MKGSVCGGVKHVENLVYAQKIWVKLPAKRTTKSALILRQSELMRAHASNVVKIPVIPVRQRMLSCQALFIKYGDINDPWRYFLESCLSCRGTAQLFWGKGEADITNAAGVKSSKSCVSQGKESFPDVEHTNQERDRLRKASVNLCWETHAFILIATDPHERCLPSRRLTIDMSTWLQKNLNSFRKALEKKVSSHSFWKTSISYPVTHSLYPRVHRRGSVWPNKWKVSF